MADPKEIQQANQQIAEALSYGANEEDIYNHLRQSAEPHHMEIVRRYDMAEGMKKAAALNGSQPESEDQSQLSKVSQWVTTHPVETAAGATAAYLGKKVLLDPIIEARKAAAIAKAEAAAPVSPAVDIQARQLEFNQQKFYAEQAAAQQSRQDLAQQSTTAPNARPKTELELIAEEHARVKLEADKAKMAREAELHQAKLEGLARKAAAELQNNQGKPSSVNSPANDQAKQMMESSAVAQVQKESDAKLKAATPPAGTPITAVTPPAAEPTNIGQALAIEATPPTELTTPQEPTQEVAKTTTNEPPVVTNQKAIEARVPPEGMRTQYTKNKANPMGPGAFNHLANNLGIEKAIEVWEGRYGKTNVPYSEFMPEFEKAAGKQMHGPVKPLAEGAKPGGSFGKPEHIPEYIRGSAPIEAMGRTALAALGILPVAQKLKQGDYKGALNEAIPASAFIDPRISLALSPLYTSEEEIATLKKAEQGRKVGAGRGIAPPSAYQR